MTRLQIRALIYGVIAGGQTLTLGINEGTMTARDWIQLAVSSIVSAAIAVRALYDTSDFPASATATLGDVDRSPRTSATDAGDASITTQEIKKQ